VADTGPVVGMCIRPPPANEATANPKASRCRDRQHRLVR